MTRNLRCRDDTARVQCPLAAAALTDLELRSQLASNGPDLIALLLSFSVAAMFWRGNQKLLSMMRQSDRPAIFPSLAFLLSVVFLPISTTLYGAFGATRTVAVIYSGNLAVIGILQFCLWLHTLGQPLRTIRPALASLCAVALRLSGLQHRLSHQFLEATARAIPLVCGLRRSSDCASDSEATLLAREHRLGLVQTAVIDRDLLLTSLGVDVDETFAETDIAP
ncbi:MAG: DUF1211 domain-containing protein [Burkholderiaceae bacterium]|nr:DUF1211 domain-containing protein [Burkholderiaceae bacterium]